MIYQLKYIHGKGQLSQEFKECKMCIVHLQCNEDPHRI